MIQEKGVNTLTRLYAQPYDIAANGFYFDDAESYERQAKANRNDYCDLVEEYEIQFIDGTRIDCELANAFGLNQVNFTQFFDYAENWDEDQKQRFIIAVGECGYAFNAKADNVDDFDVDIYPVETLRDLAEQFVDEGLFGEIPKHLENYIDLEAIARDLSMDYTITEIAGQRFAYRCG